MKLFAHARHVYEDRATHHLYEIAAGAWLEVPDDVGAFLLSNNGLKLCDVSREKEPGRHSCSKTKKYAVSTLAPDLTTHLTPEGRGRVSRQRLNLRRQTYKRSRVARMQRAGAA